MRTRRQNNSTSKEHRRRVDFVFVGVKIGDCLKKSIEEAREGVGDTIRVRAQETTGEADEDM